MIGRPQTRCPRRQPYQAGGVSQVSPKRLRERCCGVGVGPIEEEPVERGAGSGDVGAEGSAARISSRERRAREVVRGSAARSAARDAREAVERARGGARPSRALRRARRRRRRRPRSSSSRVAREKQRRRRSPAAGRAARGRCRRRSELRAVGEEERDVGAEPRPPARQLVGRERRGERSVREAERRRGVGAAAAEAGCDRDVLLDFHAPTRLDSRGRGERSSAARTSVSPRNPSTRAPAPPRARSGRRGRSVGGRWHLVLAVVARRPDDEREVDLRGGGARFMQSFSASATNSAGASASARVSAGRPSARAPPPPAPARRARRARASSGASSAGGRRRPRRPA